jgi:hypothetical protein
LRIRATDRQIEICDPFVLDLCLVDDFGQIGLGREIGVSGDGDALDLPFCVGFFEPEVVYYVEAPVMGVLTLLAGFTAG